MAEERGAQPEAPRMTMYQLLHPTQSSIPSCIIFPPNAPHMEIKQGLMVILPNFRGLENENPYVHVRAFEKVIGSFYAQNVIETAKLRFFPFSLKDKAKGWLYIVKPRKISNFAQGNDETLFMAWERFKDTYNFCTTHGYDTWKEPEDAMDYLDEIAKNSNTWNGPSPLDSTDRNRSSTTTSGGSIFRLRDRGQHECQDQFETMFTRIDEEMREIKSQSAKVVNTDKFEEVKSITILRNGKEIGKDAPKANEKSKETPAEKDESGIAKSNDIEKCPFPCTIPTSPEITQEFGCHKNGRMKITFGSMTAELNIFNVNPQQLVDEKCEYVNFIEILEKEQVVVAKNPPRSKKKSLLAYLDAPKLKLKQPPRELQCASIEPHATSTMEVPSKESVDQEVEKAVPEEATIPLEDPIQGG
uniref:Retrotransposon gag domain-containing protein n=1 Tax=Fagus sylvatica TaxID=28930 RepID=A0A2N9GCZ7_FAGSY